MIIFSNLPFKVLLILWTAAFLQPATTDCNLALHGSAKESSTKFSIRPAGNAVDGDKRGTYSLGACTHTLVNSYPWWMVDLGRDFTVRRVTLYNRLDCCSERLHDVHVGVTSDDPGSPALGSYPLCGTHPGIVGSVGHITCPQGVKGRYVIVQLDDPRRPLSLCEVEVSQSARIGDGSGYIGELGGHRLTGQSFIVVQVVSKLECVALCMENEECISVNLSSKETGGVCELNNGSCSPPTGLTPHPDWTWIAV